MIVKVDYLFWLAGALLAITSAMTLADRAHPKRWTTGAFWGVFAILFLFGDWMPRDAVGALIVAATLIAGCGGVGHGAARTLPDVMRRLSARRLGNRLFVPALAIPLGTLAGTLLFAHARIGGHYLFDPKNTTLISLGASCIVAVWLACRLTGETLAESVRQARGLTESLGWALVLPQTLAMVGLVFADAGVGKSVAYLTDAYVNTDVRLVAIVVYVLGMALFTIATGGAFAAFPVMMVGVGVPILIHAYHGNPAVIAAVGMFAGYSGTLLTPMAASFNVVPVALLSLPDKYAVIRVQIPTALILLVANVALLDWLM
ncbi:DUF979 domain-containing protein [Burkholderia sp. WAC0059]|uniref:DUF979 domain-containing protein n=1 Tax=Burkholderia sp. WAC0059 TaxID=2066022 RepID=UPI000C7EDB5B|nr:DUF979 domain-containing protein [Burkholderia sp. WAC0059]PLZ02367.1 DUF979 domain-containing protein [Burkholderia sp. WAC0059]